MAETISLGQYGPWGLVSVFVMLVFLGGLLPRWTHNQRMRDKDEIIKFLRDTVEKRDEQFDVLMKQGEMIVKLLEDIKKVSVDREATRT
jgi:hypothetical protein